MAPARRPLLVALALAALCAIIAVKMCSDPEAERGELGVEPSTPDERDAPGLLGTGHGPDGADPDAAGTRVAAGARPAKKGPAGPPDEELRGTIVVTDPEGARHAEVSGSFTMHVRHRAGVRELLVRVERGAWRVQAPPALGISVTDLELDGTMACATWDEIAVAPGQAPVIEAWWPRPSILLVEDRETGKPLLDLALVQAGRFDDERAHPSDGWTKRIAGTGLAAPITLPHRDGTPTWYVWAPGYAWGHVAVDQRRGGEHRVALLRGGDVEVRFTGAKPAQDAALIVTRPAPSGRGTPLAEFRLEGHAPILVDGLPAGIYGLEVRVGRRGKRLAEGRAEVRVGERREATLELDASEELPTVPLAGVVRFQEAPAPTTTSLWFSNRDSAARPRAVYLDATKLVRDPERAGLLVWDAGVVPIGTWRVEVRPYGVVAEFELGPRGLPNAVIDMPELCELRVEVRDAHSGDSAKEVEVRFVRKRALPPGGGSLSWDPGLARWTARVPVGAASVEADGPLHREVGKALVLAQGVNEIRLDLPRAEVVVLHFREGDAVVPLDKVHYVVLVDEEGEEHAERLYDRGRQQMYLSPPGPGRYRLRVDVPERYEPVQGPWLEFGPAQRLEHTVHLQRRR